MKRKLCVSMLIAIVTGAMLVGCGKSNDNNSLQTNSNDVVSDVAVIPAEGGSVYETPENDMEDVKVDDNTMEVTFEEYMNIVLKRHATVTERIDTNAFVSPNSMADPSTDGLVVLIKDVNDAANTFSRGYVIYNENLNAESAVEMAAYEQNCYDGNMELLGFNREMIPNENGTFNLFGVSRYVLPGYYLADEFPERVSHNISFEYDSALDSNVMKSVDGNVLAYFGQYSTTEYADTKFATFTTNLSDGEYVAYIPMDNTANFATQLYPHRTMTEKEFVFVTHH